MSGARAQESAEAPAASDARDVAWALVPPTLLVVFASVCGTFDAPIRGPWVVAGHGLVIGLALAGCRAGLDPLGLGPPGRWLLAALLAWATLSTLRSPVPRAAFEGLLLATPLVMCVPAVARCWSTARRRHIGRIALSACLLVVSVWALCSAVIDSGRPARPLGHHNLLAMWLVALLPLAGLPGREHRSSLRWLRWGASGAAVLTILATRSLGASIALAVLVAVAAMRSRVRGWRWLAATALIVLGWLAASRLVDMASGDDISTRARIGYLSAAVRGAADRPLTGWGPGAAAWTLAGHIRPVPGVHPPGEVVADPHSLPALLTYELGIVGVAILAVLAWVFLRRRPEREVAAAHAAHLGLLAFAVAAAFTRPGAATALWLVLIVLAGTRRAALPTRTWHPSGHVPGTAESSQSTRTWHPRGHVPGTAESSHSTRTWHPRGHVPGTAESGTAESSQSTRTWHRSVAVILVLGCGLSLAVLDAARLSYGKAIAARNDGDSERWLGYARRLDPLHPLYRARWAEIAVDDAAALSAARSAYGVAALWLAAGHGEAMVMACRLDPLAATAWLDLAIDQPDRQNAIAQAARALLADPRLLAATAWTDHPGLRIAAVDRVVSLSGVDAGWRRAFAERAAVTLPAGGPRAAIAVYADRDPAEAMSLHVFRRPPWPWRLASIRVDADAVSPIDLPSAARLSTTAAGVFDRSSCAAD